MNVNHHQESLERNNKHARPGLANKQTTNYYLMSHHEQTKLANSGNRFCITFYSYTTTYADPVVAADSNEM